MAVLNKQSVKTTFDLIAATFAGKAAAAKLLVIAPVHVVDVKISEHNIVGGTKIVFANLDPIQFRLKSGSRISDIEVAHLEVFDIGKKDGRSPRPLCVNSRFGATTVLVNNDRLIRSTATAGRQEGPPPASCAQEDLVACGELASIDAIKAPPRPRFTQSIVGVVAVPGVNVVRGMTGRFPAPCGAGSGISGGCWGASARMAAEVRDSPVNDFASAAIPPMLCATEKIAKGRSCQRLGERRKAIR
jgi:hypothetical protein